MNKLIMMGRLTKDPEVRVSQGGATVTRLTIAVDRKYTKNSDTTTDFINWIAFGKTGENIGKFLTKGRKILLTGRVENNNYTDKNGNKVYQDQHIVEEFDFCDSKSSGDSQQQNTAPDGSAWLNIPDELAEEMPFK